MSRPNCLFFSDRIDRIAFQSLIEGAGGELLDRDSENSHGLEARLSEDSDHLWIFLKAPPKETPGGELEQEDARRVVDLLGQEIKSELVVEISSTPGGLPLFKNFIRTIEFNFVVHDCVDRFWRRDEFLNDGDDGT